MLILVLIVTMSNANFVFAYSVVEMTDVDNLG